MFIYFLFLKNSAKNRDCKVMKHKLKKNIQFSSKLICTYLFEKTTLSILKNTADLLTWGLGTHITHSQKFWNNDLQLVLHIHCSYIYGCKQASKQPPNQHQWFTEFMNAEPKSRNRESMHKSEPPFKWPAQFRPVLFKVQLY